MKSNKERMKQISEDMLNLPYERAAFFLHYYKGILEASAALDRPEFDAMAEILERFFRGEKKRP